MVDLLIYIEYEELGDSSPFGRYFSTFNFLRLYLVKGDEVGVYDWVGDPFERGFEVIDFSFYDGIFPFTYGSHYEFAL